MIEFIEGNIIEKGRDFVVIEKGGIGFKIFVPYEINTNKLYIKLFIKDEQIVLYGFKNREDRDIFEQLLSVSGIGVKHAFSILRSFTPTEFFRIVEEGDVESLIDVPGIGKKTAQRIVLELRGKINFIENELVEDIVNALTGLGFEKKEALYVAKEAAKESKELEKALKIALQKLSEKG